MEEKRRTEKGTTHRQPAGGQESDTKREEEKEGEKSCRSNIRGRRRKQDQIRGPGRRWQRRFRVCIVAIFLVDVLPLIYNHSILSQKRIKQSIPIIIGPSGYRILVISSSTVPLTLFLDNFLGSLHPREPQFDYLEVQKFSTTEK